MAVVIQAPELPSTTVQRERASPELTTSITLNLLRALLGYDLKHEKCSQDKSTAKITKPQSSKKILEKKLAPIPKNGIRRTAAPKSGNSKLQAPAFEIYDSETSPPAPLSTEKRRALATTTFNSTLKALSDAAKVTNSPTESREVKPQTKVAQNPLQNCSPNRRPRPVLSGKKNLKSEISTSDSRNGIEITAECAATVLHYLFENSASDVSNAKPKQTDDWRLERGALILLDKLITLKMKKLARQEVSVIRLHLDRRLGTTSKAQKPSKNITNNDLLESLSLADAIQIEFDHSKENVFNLITSFQSQVLRVGLLGRECITDELIEVLRPKTKLGPCFLIQEGIKIGHISKETGAQQLRTLSQALMNLCAIDQPRSEGSPEANVSPDKIFAMRCVGLEIRCHSWALQKATEGVERDIWTHFHRALCRYQEDCKIKGREQYQLVQNTIRNLQEMALLADIDSQLPNYVINSLADIADKSGFSNDSISLLQRQLDHVGEDGGIQHAISACKIATIRLNLWQEDCEASLSDLDRVLKLLRTSLKGSSSEFNDLLLHGARLRRVALSTATDIERLMNEQPGNEIQNSIQTCAIRVIFAFLHLVILYMKSKFAKVPAGIAKVVPMQQIQATNSLCQNALDSVMLLSKCASSRKLDLWPETDLALLDCVTAARLIEENHHAQPDHDVHIPGMFVRISNVYWTKYLETKEKAPAPRDCIRTVESSVKVLADRPLTEKTQGFLALKYERLASMQIEAKNFREARHILSTSIALQISMGVLSEAVEVSLSRPSREVWSDQTPRICTLGKSLLLLAEILSSCDSSTESIYDDTNLPASHRAVALEKQVLALFNLPGVERLTDTVIKYSKIVLNLYGEAPYSVCRLRFAYALLDASSKSLQVPILEIFDNDIEYLLQEPDLSSSPKLFLAPYQHTLLATLRLHWAFQTSVPQLEALEQPMDLLKTSVFQCDSSFLLHKAVEDPIALRRQLNAVADYAGMRDWVSLKLKALQVVQHILKYESRKDVSDLVICITGVGSAQLKLGETLEAGRSFALAEKRLHEGEISTTVSVQWSLAYAEYLFEILNSEKCAKVLDAAGTIAGTKSVDQLDALSPRSRLERDACLGHAALLASKLAFHRGETSQAITFARQSVKLGTGVWMSIEKLWVSTNINGTTNGPDHSEKPLSKNSLAFRLPSNGAAFWPYVDLHFSSLLHMSLLHSHCGQYQDAVHYAEQAIKLGALTGSNTWSIRAQSALSLLLVQGGFSEKALSCMQMAQSLTSEHSTQADICQLFLDQTSVLFSTGDIERASECLSKAEAALTSMGVGHCDNVDLTQVGQLEKSIQKLQIADHKPLRFTNKKLPVSGLRARPPLKTKPFSGKVQSAEPAKDIVRAPLLGRRLSAQLNLLRARMALKVGNKQETLSLVAKSGDHLSSLQRIESCTLESSAWLSKAIEVLSTDPIHSVLAESAIGLPTRYHSDSSIDPKPAKPSRGTRDVPTTSNRRTGRTDLQNVQSDTLQPQEILRKAYDILSTGFSFSLNDCPSIALHKAEKLLSHLSLISSIASSGTVCAPRQYISQSMISRDLVRKRELWAVQAETGSSERCQLQQWPQAQVDKSETPSCSNIKTLQTNHAELLKSIPDSWTVLSLTLSENQTDLLVSRISAGKTPFVLRIPLSRSNMDDLEDTDFTFDMAKDEMKDIIANANRTAHDARGQAEKQARKLWWAERESLDQRLEALLSNIENVWLGGFRGIFSRIEFDQDFLSRFAESLAQSLDKHLPSRQKPGVTKTRMQLHAHVMELFVSLGHPDEIEIEDSITDLLYFVVDILQFSGERNAYDEIDFDIIMMEVMDALRSYHEANSTSFSEQTQHTILILDKELHLFPWESLPCLSGQPVSRMPSLSAIHERLEMIQAQNQDGQSLRISSKAGSYILNPSSDLTSTQETFFAPFSSQLPAFNSIVNRVPTESEFTSCLQDSSLFLYFGHGSGAQYIRGRSIKKLDRCAVTFLMGCSSGKMIECGDFEPYGVPANYLLAGCPAVVGTLWDVTDKDIDRFALNTFEEWGLLDRDLVEQGRKGKGKASSKSTKTDRSAQTAEKSYSRQSGKASLDEAVAKAREVCVLRYLNGAAPVIYGIPVVLE